MSHLAERGDAVFQLDLQHHGEERAEDVAADGLVELVEDGRVANRCFSVRKFASTVQNCL